MNQYILTPKGCPFNRSVVGPFGSRVEAEGYRRWLACDYHDVVVLQPPAKQGLPEDDHKK